MVENCVECGKVGATTECQYMEFPVGVHHYFDQKVCTLHYWTLYVKPKRRWQEYLKFVQADSVAAGYHLTLPSDEVVKAGTA